MSREFVSEAPHRLLVRRAIEEVWNDGRLEVADELFATTYVNHGGVILDLVRGPEAIKVSVAFYRAAFPLLHIVIEEVHTDGETVVLRWTARSGRPPSAGARAQGSGHEGVTGTIRSRLADGKIGETWIEWDRDGALRRLGLVPAVAA
ncbi:MAG TPA: ester cyclase [Thermomicrobiaceae bacterium]|nr:ester cyclase [Thermomicrobiaceae bacterium]